MAKLKFTVLIYWIVTLATVVFLTNWSIGVSLGAMSDCIDATCRITAPDGGCGSGCVFEISQGNVYALTAAHVVGDANTVKCEYWRDGHLSGSMTGKVVARSQAADAAIVAVPVQSFAGILPKTVPIAAKSYVVKPGDTLTSVGCANGTWSTGWKGHALGYSESDLHFLPTPANGRSGSAIFDADGKMIVAVLRARTINDSEGIATPVQCLYDVFGADVRQSGIKWQESTDATLAQCPGGQCPVPGGAQSGQTPYLLPYRYREQFRNQQPTPAQPGQSSPAWPTLPSGSSSGVDLSPTNEKLDKIADLLLQMKAVQTPPPVPVAETPAPVSAPIDNKAREAAAEAKALADKVAKDNETVLGKLGRIDSVVEKFGGDPETLIQRVLDRVDKVKGKLGPDAEPDDVVKAYAKDLIKEKIKEGVAAGPGALIDKLAAVGGGLPATGLLIFGCVVVWKLVNNKPLAIEKIAPDSFIGQKAGDLREHIASALAPIKEQIDAKLNHITGVAADAKSAAEAAKAVSQVVSAQAMTSTAAK